MKNKFKGTQGKWMFRKSTAHNGSSFRIQSSIGEEKLKICNIVSRDKDESEHNAKLISNAPDLLNSCIELLELLRFHGYQNSTEIYNAQKVIEETLT